MAEYEIFFKESVWKDSGKVPKRDLNRILSRIEKLEDDPRSTGCEKLTAQELYRVWQGKYRIVCSIQEPDLTVGVIQIGRRKGMCR